MDVISNQSAARQEPSLIEIDNDKAVGWLNKGAQPTDPVKKLLEISGAWSQFKVAKGEIHTVAPKAPPVVDAAVDVEEAAAENAPAEEGTEDE